MGHLLLLLLLLLYKSFELAFLSPPFFENPHKSIFFWHCSMLNKNYISPMNPGAQ
jgi:hypothetical protein